MGSPLGEYLRPPGYASPRLRALTRESSVVIEAGRLVRRRAAVLARLSRPTDSGPRRHPVLLVPGFLAGDYALAAMARHLREDGYRTYRAGIVVNALCTQDTLSALEARVEGVVSRRGESAILVGHSLGGLLSRGLAARRPDLVAGIVTLGSPVMAPGAVHALLTLDLAVLVGLQRLGLRQLLSLECTAGTCGQARLTETRRNLPPGFPYTAVYSQRDGVVDWRACVEPAAIPVEVTTSHCGMAIDPTVFGVVTAALARVESRTAVTGLPPAAEQAVS